MQADIPPEYLCPLLQTLMEDPVITEDGYIFERRAIQGLFLEGTLKNPISGNLLQSRQLIPVQLLKSLIQRFKKERQLKNGKGIQYWADGGRYQGHYLQGKRHGFGTEYWSDGGMYQGEFQDGKRSGKGKQFWSDGGMFEGTFVNGKRQGFGKQIWADGGKFEGHYADGKRQGEGFIHYEDGSVIKGNYNQGKRIGKGILVNIQQMGVVDKIQDQVK